MMMRIAFLVLVVVGCHRPTPPEEEPGRPLCVADRAAVCTLRSSSIPTDRACTDGKGHKCARCYPTDAALNWCFLDGTTSCEIDGATAADWVTCVSDCQLCVPAEALAIDKGARCAVDNDESPPSSGAAGSGP